MRDTFFPSERYATVTDLNKKIFLKGRDEQERQFLFPSLYGNKAITKRTKGAFKNANGYKSHHNYITLLK